MDWLSLIVSYSWSSQVETTQELTSLAGKLDLATTYLGRKRSFSRRCYKSMEADYSNHLASPLVASCGEISPSPRIRCDKIKSPTRDAVLGHLETGHPKNRTQCGVTHPLKPCLIGICKDMMS